LTDSARGLDKQGVASSDTGNLNSSVAGASESPAVGIAICDDQLRYVSVNPVLAAMNGIPLGAHIGKTVREVIGGIASRVELMLRSVLFTGQSILNTEIMGELPTRNEVGYWIANYFPVHDSTARVRQVGALVVEITSLRKLVMCIPTLMGNMPRTIDQVRHLGMAYGLEKESPESWSGSIEMMENSVREMLNNSHKLQPPAQMPNMRDVVTHQQKHGSTPVGNNGAKPLSPREVEIVKLVAKGNGNKEISTALKISVKTVETYRAKIMLKLQIHSLSDLVLYAVRCELVKP